LCQSLEDVASTAASNIQSHVYKHYSEFVAISKEISKLEADMLHIRGQIEELHDLDGLWDTAANDGG
jgi:hypothetical protein